MALVYNGCVQLCVYAIALISFFAFALLEEASEIKDTHQRVIYCRAKQSQQQQQQQQCMFITRESYQKGESLVAAPFIFICFPLYFVFSFLLPLHFVYFPAGKLHTYIYMHTAAA